MKEIFDWVPWFQQLANKINEGGRQILAENVRRIDWKPKDPALLKLEDEDIDPFSFIYYLAALNTQNNWQTIYRRVADVFDIRTRIEYRHEGFYYPTPPAVIALFYNPIGGNPSLLWELFGQAVADSVQSDTFETVLTIPGVGVSKLTQALFLIDPSKFLPFDDHGTLALEIGSYKKPPPEIRWDEYRQEMELIKETFPGCACYEIQHFSYLWNNEEMPINRGTYYQVSTNVYDDDEDHWDDFDKNNWVYTGGPKSGTPYPASVVPVGGYPLKDPIRGDIVLVRYKQEGRGIGIVYENDYSEDDVMTENSRLHVLWLNKKSAESVINFRLRGFSRAWKPTQQAFMSVGVYSRTSGLISQLGRDKPDPPNGPSIESVKHPLNQILYGPPGTGKTWHAVNYAMAIVDGVDVKEVGDEDRARLHDLLFRFENAEEWHGQIAMVTFHQSFSYEDFVEGIRPRLKDDQRIRYEIRPGIFKQIAHAASASAEEEQRFVLIIDEINRGNIPKIFGELITLIEDSKRFGEPDEMRVTLPYSNKTFGVPGNLYIIGTMNTADRSILLLDTALRRRFDFVEMMPDPEHELISRNVEGVDAQEMLKAMNERISLLLDRDHQIGHTYLINVNDLKTLSDKFRNAIVPLLQEYFYDDWPKISYVLGGAGFVAEQRLDYAAQFRNTDLVDEDPVVYKRLPGDDAKWRDAKEYKKIYSDDRRYESS